MKRTFIALAIVAAATVSFSSCSTFTKERCWEIKSTVTVNGESNVRTYYHWGSSLEVAGYVMSKEFEIKEELGENTIVESKSTAVSKYKNQEDCEAQNN